MRRIYFKTFLSYRRVLDQVYRAGVAQMTVFRVITPCKITLFGPLEETCYPHLQSDSV